MSEHTPGPWRYNCDGEGRKIISDDGGTVVRLSHLAGPCGTRGRKPDSEVVANGHLIAAAPLMLDALENLVIAIELPGEHCEVEQAMRQARAALQAAKGGEDNVG